MTTRIEFELFEQTNSYGMLKRKRLIQSPIFLPEEELESLLLLEFPLLESLDSLLSLLDELEECRLRFFDFFFFDFFKLLSLRGSATLTLPVVEPSPRFCSLIFKLSAEKIKFYSKRCLLDPYSTMYVSIIICCHNRAHFHTFKMNLL